MDDEVQLYYQLDMRHCQLDIGHDQSVIECAILPRHRMRR